MLVCGQSGRCTRRPLLPVSSMFIRNFAFIRYLHALQTDCYLDIDGDNGFCVTQARKLPEKDVVGQSTKSTRDLAALGKDQL